MASMVKTSMNRATVVVVFIVLSSTTGRMQAHPSFSGSWKQDMQQSAKTSLQGYAERIAQTDTAVTITMISTMAPGREKTATKTYEIGKSTTSVDREGDTLVSTVSWEGASLVFATIEKEGRTTIVTRETWTLSDDGKTLTKVHTTRGTRHDEDRRYVFNKTGT